MRVSVGARATLRRWWPQPLVGGATAAVGLVAVVPLLVAMLRLCGATVAAYWFPLHVRPQTTVYLLVVLLLPPLAATAGAFATLKDKLSGYRQRRTRWGDTASEVDRRIPLLLLGALIAQLPGATLSHVPALVLAAGGPGRMGDGRVWRGDAIVAAEALPAPVPGVSRNVKVPWQKVRECVRDVGSTLDAQVLSRGLPPALCRCQRHVRTVESESAYVTLGDERGCLHSCMRQGE